jgi:predicted nucleic acid-binding protein
VALAWAFEDEADEHADAALEAMMENGAAVPGLWGFEVVNALVVGERRGRIAAADSARFLELLRGLPIEVEEAPLSRLTEVLPVARERGLSAYDAAYLAVAMRRGLSLATQDTALRKAASDTGVALFSP